MSDQADTMKQTPKGQRLESNFGPGTLRPGVKMQCIKAGEMLFCGSIVGVAYDFTEHPNAKDPTKISTRFAGRFMAICHDGRKINTAEAYLPSVIERTVKGILKTGKQEFVPISGEVWAEPDEEGGKTTAQGFRYAFFDRNNRGDADPMLQLAYETGILERPVSTAAISAPAETEEVVDPETGEITREPVAKQSRQRKAA
jgi:hypothetical protein